MRTLTNKTKSKNANRSPFFKGQGNVGFFSVQPKLNIGKANDKYEVEADSVADAVMRKSESQPFFASTPVIAGRIQTETSIRKKPLAQSITPLVQRREEEEEAQTKLESGNSVLMEEEEEAAQPKLETGYSIQKQEEEEEEAQTKLESNPFVQKHEEDEEIKGAEPTSKEPTVQQQLNNSNSGGEALSQITKSEMETNFGADFSQVRTHTDANAVKMNKKLGAQAFTQGNNIYFNEGKLSPGTKSGKQLLAHELAHTIQQGASSVKQDRESSNVANNGGVESQAAERDVAIPNERTQTTESSTENKQEQIPNVANNGGVESQVAEQDTTITNETTKTSDARPGNEKEQILNESNLESTTQQDQTSESQAQEENVVPETQSDIQNSVESIQQPQAESEEQTEIRSDLESERTRQQSQESESAGTAEEKNEVEPNGENTQPEQQVTETSGSQNMKNGSSVSNSNIIENSVTKSDALIQILSSPNSQVRTHGIYLSQLVMAGGNYSQEQILQHGNLRRQQVNQQFNGVHSGLFSFFNNNFALVKSIIENNKALVTNVSVTTISKVVGFVMNAISRGEALSSTFANIIMGAFGSASSFVTNRIAGIVGRIMNVVSYVPLPNIPGIERIRITAQNMVARIAGVVQRSLGTVLGAIHRAFSTGLNMLFTIINNLRAKVLQIMTKIIKVIMHALSKIIRALNHTLKKIVSILRRVLFGIILPGIMVLRARILQTIYQLEFAALQQIRNIEEENIEAIASFVVAESEDGDGLEKSMITTIRDRQEKMNAMKLVLVKSMAQFLIAVQLFKAKTNSVISLFIANLVSVARQIKSRIIVLTGRALSTIISFSVSVISIIERIFTPVAVNIKNLLYRSFSAVVRLVNNVTRLIRRPVDRVINLAERSLSLLRDKVRRLILRI